MKGWADDLAKPAFVFKVLFRIRCGLFLHYCARVALNSESVIRAAVRSIRREHPVQIFGTSSEHLIVLYAVHLYVCECVFA